MPPNCYEVESTASATFLKDRVADVDEFVDAVSTGWAVGGTVIDPDVVATVTRSCTQGRSPGQTSLHANAKCSQ